MRRLLLLAALALLLSACSSHSLKGTPIWDGDYRSGEPTNAGPPEERVNVWPLFYHRDPATSILWPLITLTDEGHSVYPLYEYLSENDRLTVGVLHPWVPAVAERREDGNFWRFLHVAHDKEKGFTTAIPLFYLNDSLLWTPLYTTNRGDTDDFKGVLGPLFFKSGKGDSRMAYFPFPLAGFWWNDSVGGQLLPLFYYNKPGGVGSEGATTNVGGLLFHNKYRAEDSYRGFYAFPLGWFGRDGREGWNYLLPLWLSRSDGNVRQFASPVWIDMREEDGERLRIVPPLLFIDKNDSDYQWTSFPFPFVHRIRKDEGNGLTVIPLFSHFKRPDGSWRFLSLPFSIEKDEWLNVMGPLYFRRFGDDRGQVAALWPLFHYDWEGAEEKRHYLFPLWYYRKTPSHRTFLSPLYAAHSRDDVRIDAAPLLLSGTLAYDESRYSTFLFPLFHHYHDDRGQSVFGAFPLGVYSKSENGTDVFSPLAILSRSKNGDSLVNLGTVLFSHMRSGTFSNWWVLGSILGTSADTEKGREWHVFPLFYHSTFPANKTRWRSLLGLLAWSETDKRTEQEVAEEVTSGMQKYQRKIMTFWDSQQTTGSLATALPRPTYSHTMTRTEDLVKQRYLLGLGGVNDQLKVSATLDAEGELTETDTHRSKGSWLFPLWYYRKDPSYRTFRSLLYAVHSKDDVRIDAVPLLLSGTRADDTSRYSTFLFPLFHHYHDDRGQRVFGALPLGLYCKWEDTTEFFSPLASFRDAKDGDSFLNLGMFLFGHMRSGTFSSWWVLGSILGTAADTEKGREWHVFPLFYHSTFPANKTRWRSLLGLLAWSETDKRTEQEVADGLASRMQEYQQTLMASRDAQETTGTLATALPAPVSPRTMSMSEDLVKQRYLLGLGGVSDKLELSGKLDAEGELTETDTHRTKSSWLFPVWYQRDIVGGRHRACVLGRLYDEVSEPHVDGGTYHRQRVLWRVYHRERLEDHTSIDVFPFLAFDTAPDLRKYSFAGGLAEYSRKDGKRRIKLLWIPIGLGD
ncbi:MAG: hypothetical protein PWP23_1203 [Candidatus Sumerlaeota bacterium]|nr:hypothetical protein [Candidatus Sumerlaeota bacterium]